MVSGALHPLRSFWWRKAQVALGYFRADEAISGVLRKKGRRFSATFTRSLTIRR